MKEKIGGPVIMPYDWPLDCAEEESGSGCRGCSCGSDASKLLTSGTAATDELPAAASLPALMGASGSMGAKVMGWNVGTAAIGDSGTAATTDEDDAEAEAAEASIGASAVNCGRGAMAGSGAMAGRGATAGTSAMLE